MRVRHALASCSAVLVIGTSCSGGDTDVAADTASASAPAPAPASSTPPEEPGGVVLQVTITGDSVSPSGELVELGVGEPLTIELDSDRAGELHVHSKPEQYLEFEAGASSREIVIDVPGSAEIEEHDTGDVVAQLQIR